MKKIKGILCLISSILAVSTAALTASAIDGSGILGNAIAWTVKNNIVDLRETNGKWTAECKEKTMYVKGEKLESIALSSDEFLSPANSALSFWFSNNKILKFYLDVNEVNAMLSLKDATNTITQVTIGKNVKKLSGSCKINSEALRNIAVIAKNIELEGTDIGFDAEGEPIEDLIIHGYKESTAEAYAKNNGFEFMQIGDITYDGKIDIQDVIQVARYLINLRDFDSEETITADYNGDNTIDIQDAIGIAREI